MMKVCAYLNELMSELRKKQKTDIQTPAETMTASRVSRF